MKNYKTRNYVIVALVLAGIAVTFSINSWMARAQDKPPARPPEAIIKDLDPAGEEWHRAVGGPQNLFDAAKRREVAAKAIPPGRRMVALFDELSAADTAIGERIAGARLQFLGFLALLGDSEAAARLGKQAAGQGREAEDSKVMLVTVDWWRAEKDQAAQARVFDAVAPLARKHPENISLAILAITVAGEAESRGLRDKAEKLLREELKSDLAEQMADVFEMQAELRERFEGKPLTIDGVLLDGKQFSTAQWKGKVILVDFWATWCLPCLQELPRVTKVYKDFHEKGLEIVSISCDDDAESLTRFLQENPEIAWPQMFDAANPGFARAREYGIDRIPAMFLIDKQGLVRSVTAGDNFEELIPKMLKE